MQDTARRAKITVSADGTGLVSQAGVAALAETLRVTGIDDGLSAGLARWRAGRAVHDLGEDPHRPGHGAGARRDCLADVAVLRAQPQQIAAGLRFREDALLRAVVA